MANPVQKKHATSKLSYPYVASSERSSQISKKWRLIKLGMNPSNVVSILGEPDEVRPLYEPKVKKAKVIGKTFWFLIQRLKETGSAIEKNEKLVRISFDQDDVVTSIDHWGFEPG